MFPILAQFYMYLLKNYEHPKAFRIDACARMHITVPYTSDKSIHVTLPAHRITRDSFLPDDLLLEEEPEVEEIKCLSKPQSEAQTLAPYFGKKKKRGTEAECLDLEEETPRS
jgi:hypothetical protein